MFGTTTKKVAAAGMAIVLLTGVGAEQTHADPASAASVKVAFAPLSFLFNGIEMSPPKEDSGFIMEGTTYVPLRFMANAVEKTVSWDGDTSTVTVSEPTREERIAIRERNLNGSDRESVKLGDWKPSLSSISVYHRSVSYVFDGETKEPAAEKSGLIYNNKVYVPLRFFGESVGQNIQWDAATYTIAVSTAAAAPADSKPAAANEAPNKAPEKPAAEKPAAGTPSPVFGGGGGGGGGAVAAPTYASLTSSAEVRLTELRNRCESRLSALADRFVDADSLADQLALMAEGERELAACDASFDSIVNQLQADLARYGYSTAIINDYRTQYEALKQEKMNQLLNRL